MNEFVKFPNWYKNIEYIKEKERGNDCYEDLFVPGYFECPIRKGQSIIFSASLEPAKPSRLQTIFNRALDKRPGRDSYINCLKLSASQFLISRKGKTQVIAGYPWLGRCARDTAIALPGLTLYADNGAKIFSRAIETLVKEEDRLYETADAPLWLFWTLQHYLDQTGDKEALWKDYGNMIKSVIKRYREGTDKVKMHPNGLIWTDEMNTPLTWMDSVVDNRSVVLRSGYIVEVCALWYNAVCFALDLAKEMADHDFVNEFEEIPTLIRENFLPTFWCESRTHLADFVNRQGQNIFTRPNQLLACSLPYTPLHDEVINNVLRACSCELLTPKGLRTLSPKNPLFESHSEGDPAKRQRAAHQGSVWPWLLGPYIDAQFRLFGKNFVNCARDIIRVFEEDMTEHGIGSIAQLYDGNPPHRPHGCTSSARNIAEILRVMNLIEKFDRL